MTVLEGIDPATVHEGYALPSLTVEVTYSTLAMDVAGTRDIYPIHHDPNFARSNGVRDIFLNTMWYQGLVGRFVTEWAGPESFLRKLAVSMKANNCPGDTLTVRAVVTGTSKGSDGRRLADLDVRVDNQLGPDTVVATVTVELA